MSKAKIQFNPLIFILIVKWVCLTFVNLDPHFVKMS